MRDVGYHLNGVTMKHGIVLELIPKNGFDFAKVVTDYANGKAVDLSACELIQHVSVIDSFRDEFIDYIAKYGLSAFLRRQPLTEALVAPGTNSSDVLTLLHVFLRGFAASVELVVIDPYFFAPTTDPNYSTFIEQALHPLLPTLSKLTIVTLPNKAAPTLIATVRDALCGSAPQLQIDHKTSAAFHDRFWVDPIAAKGFICGTSLNGLGKRYALIDHLQPSDAADVVTALRNEGVL